MSSISFDFAELRTLAADLGDAPARAHKDVLATTTKAALNIKRDAVKRVRGHMSSPGQTYLPHYPRSISYEIKPSGDGVDADIGPESGKPQGGMGQPIEFGGARAAPMPHMVPAWEQESSTWAEFLAEALEKAVLP